MIYLQLFWEFFQTGLFAIGGGTATIPFLYKLSDKTGWFTHTDLVNMIAVGESTPGPIGVNMATYVGYITGMKHGGILTALLGAVTATVGLVAPSVIVIVIIASLLKNFRNNKYVEHAFYGLRPASTGLIAAAGASVVIANLVHREQLAAGDLLHGISWIGVALALVLWFLTNRVKKTRNWHPIVFIGISAVVGILLKMG